MRYLGKPEWCSWEAEIEAHRLLAGQVHLILDGGYVHIQNRHGNRMHLRFLDTWFRGMQRIASWEQLDIKSGDRLEKMVSAYKRCYKLMNWRRKEGRSR